MKPRPLSERCDDGQHGNWMAEGSRLSARLLGQTWRQVKGPMTGRRGIIMRVQMNMHATRSLVYLDPASGFCKCGRVQRRMRIRLDRFFAMWRLEATSD